MVIAPSVANAQDMSGTPPLPVDRTVDRNGVNLQTGLLSLSSTDVSIGTATSGLIYRRYWNGTGWVDNVNATLTSNPQTPNLVIASYQGASDAFGGNPTVGYTPIVENGSSLTYDFSGGFHVYTNSSGRRIKFPNIYLASNPLDDSIIEVTEPSGEIVKLTYRAGTYQVCTVGANCTARILRLQTVSSTTGYQLKLEYQLNDRSNLGNTTARTQWQTVGKVTAFNGAVDYCDPSAEDCTFSRSWPNATYETVIVGTTKYFNVTDTMGFTTRYTLNGRELIAAVKRPASTTDDVVYSYTNLPEPDVWTVDDRGDLWSYYETVISTNPYLTSVMIGAPDNSSRQVVMSNGQPTSADDGMGNITEYVPRGDGQFASVTAPEGNKVENTFDTRGNITATRQIAKAGSSLSDIIIGASYPSSCANALTCNKPSSTTDARGNVTDYTYDPVHGGVLTVTDPAPTSGAVRPQTRYIYSSLYAWYKDATGALVQAPTPIWRLTGVSTCRTTASCAGTVDETKTTIAYGTTGTANNLQASAVTAAAGDGSLVATTALSYDEVGNLTVSDGPAPGTGHTTVTRYDANRRVVGVIGPDPDGSGPLPNPARRFTYDADGRVTLTEQGTTPGQTDTAWAAFQTIRQVATTYDVKGRKTVERLQAGGTTYTVSQFGYDARDRLHCATQRLNPALWDTLPASACTPQTAGPSGPDRIAEWNYDYADRVLTTVQAAGTAVSGTDTMSYTANGRLATLADPNGNTSTYVYDGFDRLAQLRYPPPGTAPTNDYEEYGYDPSGNMTSRRTRSDRTLTYSYDALDRLIVKTVPDGGGVPSWATRDVYYAYDLQGRQLAARFDTATGVDAVTNAYDALGRPTSQTTALGAVSRTLGYTHDIRGNRTGLSWPDGGQLAMTYDTLDRLVAGTVPAAGLTAWTLGYRSDGLLGSRYGGPVSTSVARTLYDYDPAGRLSQLANGFAASGDAHGVALSYNPASQIVTRTESGATYAAPYTNGSTAYTVNGLNEYKTVGPITPNYDPTGNLIQLGGQGWSYDVENRLIGSAAGAIVKYDTLGRLAETALGGSVTRYLYENENLVAEYDAAGTLLRRHAQGQGADQLLASWEGGGLDAASLRVPLADERGSIVTVARSDGSVAAINRYDEWGVADRRNRGRFGYTGQAWLSELGLSYYKARMYSPALGRFMQTDPIGYDAGTNLYAYVGNDPVNRIDPTGLQAEGGATIPGFRSYPGQTGGGGYASPPATGFPGGMTEQMSEIVLIQAAKRERRQAAVGRGARPTGSLLILTRDTLLQYYLSGMGGTICLTSGQFRQAISQFNPTTGKIPLSSGGFARGGNSYGSSLGYALGGFTVHYDATGRPVGLRDTYDFNSMDYGQRDGASSWLYPRENTTRAFGALGAVGAQPFDIRYPCS